MEYIRRYISRMHNMRVLKQRINNETRQPSDQLLYQLRYQKVSDEDKKHYKNILRLKQKIIADIPLRGRFFPEENFIDHFESVQTEQSDDNKKKFRLHSYRHKSTSQPPRAVCILFHGMNWHSNLMAHIAEDMANNSIDVCAYDFKGYGKSEGLRGYIPDLASHIEDARKFVSEVQSRYHSSTPLFLCGFSLGGLTAFHLGLTDQKAFKGIVFFAPALKSHPYFQRYPIIMGRFISRIFPKAIVTPPNKGRSSSAQSNSNVDEYLFKHDPHYYKDGLRAGTVRTICEAMMDAESLYKDFNVPFILFQGGQDRLVDPKIATIMKEQSQSQDKYIVYNHNLWHGIPLEPEIDQYTKQAIDWIHQRI